MYAHVYVTNPRYISQFFNCLYKMPDTILKRNFLWMLVSEGKVHCGLAPCHEHHATVEGHERTKRLGIQLLEIKTLRQKEQEPNIVPRPCPHYTPKHTHTSVCVYFTKFLRISKATHFDNQF